MITTAFFIKLGLSLAIGLLVARRLRVLIQKVVTRSIPMKDRMAEDFLQKLARKSALVGIGLALFLGSMLYWGMSSVWAPEAAKPLLYASESFSTPVVKEEVSVKEAAVEKEVTPALPNPINDPDPAPPQVLKKPIVALQTPAWYLQIGAFQIEANAYQVLQTQAGAHGSLSVRLASSPQESTQWKILLGPFPSAAAARAYRLKYGVSGFPRNSIGLRLL